jgi:hypothetical protein
MSRPHEPLTSHPWYGGEVDVEVCRLIAKLNREAKCDHRWFLPHSHIPTIECRKCGARRAA